MWEEITGKTMRYTKNPRLPIQKLDNFQTFFSALKEKGLTVDGLNVQAIAQGNSNQILALLHNIVRYVMSQNNNTNEEIKNPPNNPINRNLATSPKKSAPMYLEDTKNGNTRIFLRGDQRKSMYNFSNEPNHDHFGVKDNHLQIPGYNKNKSIGGESIMGNNSLDDEHHEEIILKEGDVPKEIIRVEVNNQHKEVIVTEDKDPQQIEDPKKSTHDEHPHANEEQHHNQKDNKEEEIKKDNKKDTTVIVEDKVEVIVDIKSESPEEPKETQNGKDISDIQTNDPSTKDENETKANNNDDSSSTLTSDEGESDSSTTEDEEEEDSLQESPLSEVKEEKPSDDQNNEKNELRKSNPKQPKTKKRPKMKYKKVLVKKPKKTENGKKTLKRRESIKKDQEAIDSSRRMSIQGSIETGPEMVVRASFEIAMKNAVSGDEDSEMKGEEIILEPEEETGSESVDVNTSEESNKAPNLLHHLSRNISSNKSDFRLSLPVDINASSRKLPIAVEIPHSTRAKTEVQKTLSQVRKNELELAYLQNKEAHLALTKVQSHFRKVIAKKILKALKERRTRRGYISKEILTSEKSYIEGLQLCLTHFGEPMKTFSYVDSVQHKTLFSNLEFILSFNMQLFSRIKDRIEKNWEKEGQRIGDIFVEMGLYLKVYTTYINSYTTALNIYRDLCNNKQFKEFCGKMKELPVLKGQELPAFLILPIQRLPRYVMLIQDLLKFTETEHKDHYDLGQALKTLQTTTDYVNEQKRAFENMDMIAKIQNKISHCPNLVQPSRRFLKEGPLFNIDKKKEFFYFLFSDCIIASKVKKVLIKHKRKKGEKEKDSAIEDKNLTFRFKEQISLVGCELKEISSDDVTDKEHTPITKRIKNSVSSSTLGKKVKEKEFPSSGMMQIITTSQVLSLNASSPEEKMEWLKTIDNSWSKLIDNERSRVQNKEKVLDEPPISLTQDYSNINTLSRVLYEKVDGKWRKVFCKVINTHILFYHEKTDKEAFKSIFILKSTCELSKKTDFGYSFIIKVKDGKTYKMGAEDLNTIFQWFRCVRILIRSAIEVEKRTLLQDIMLIDDSNKQCADCEMNGPQYANLYFNVFVCIGCAEVHRLFPNKEYSKIINVREEVTKEQVTNNEIRNKVSNEKYLSNLPSSFSKLQPHDDHETRRTYIFAKYITAKFDDEKGYDIAKFLFNVAFHKNGSNNSLEKK
eukprot:TRINITY_DN933_c0_g1_i1.p1 TRINITY_DN933_c0_g1~~TRINITY_DN933_c0_g1_i1.p1  ORF type:complete len:1245 (+),score=474.01 TRINITY_DN933_c0_g1_i1:142-3735(+)